MYRSYWGCAALRVLNALDLPLDADEETVTRAVREAYPFGGRSRHPYKVSLASVSWTASARPSASRPGSRSSSRKVESALSSTAHLSATVCKIGGAAPF